VRLISSATKPGSPIEFAFGPSIFDGYVLSIDIAGLTQAVAKRIGGGGGLGSQATAQKPTIGNSFSCWACATSGDAPLRRQPA
jgi:hypothetical protein